MNLIPVIRFQVNTVKTLRLCLLSLTILVAIAPPVSAEPMVALQVRAGSSLIGLANLYCHGREDWRRIAEVNNLRPPYVIKEDSALMVPADLLLGDSVSALVGAARGQARLTQPAKAAQPITTGDNVAAGSIIETGEDGYVLLIFPDQRFVRVDAASRLRVDMAMRLADGSLKIETTLEQGATLNNVKPRSRPNDSFISRSPTALTGVRGTEYRLKTDDGQSTHIETLRGEVYAEAQGVSRAVPLGQGVIVRKKQPPSPPRPLPATPSDLSVATTYNSQPLHFVLPKQPGKGVMRLTISADEQGLRVIERRIGKVGESLSVTLPQDGDYFLSLSAINEAGFESLPTPAQAFTLRTTPAAPILTIAKNARFFTHEAPLAWAVVAGATGYQVVVAADTNFAKPLCEAETATPAWQCPELPFGSYHARVRSIAADGFQSAWSETVSFSLAEPPRLLSDEMTADGPIHFRWKAVEGGATYDLQVAPQADFSDVLVSAQALRQPEYTLEQSLKPGTYYVRVRGNPVDGPPSQWGPPQKITINPAPMTLAVKLILGALILCLIL
ncbi:MAG: FecR domain-containing protein [Desulfobulbaceae bacterium]|nr:FecR domain-containing protein [Desulfobulbaceae bacterium]